MNLTEQLKDNFEIIPTDPKGEFKRIWGEPQVTYDKAVLHIIQKLKDLGYKKLPLAFRPLPYILVDNCEFTPIVAVVKDFTESGKELPSYEEFSKGGLGWSKNEL